MRAMMYMRMGKAAKEVAEYWIKKFRSRLLLEDDLRQESYLVFLRGQDFYDSEKNKSYITYYSKLLRNHFVDLYREARRRERLEELIIDKPIKNLESEDVRTWLENIPAGDWSAEDKLEWEEMVGEIIEVLSGRQLEIFFLLIAPTKEIIKLSLGSSGNITNTSLSNYFGVRRTVIDDQRLQMEDTILRLLGFQIP